MEESKLDHEREAAKLFEMMTNYDKSDWTPIIFYFLKQVNDFFNKEINMLEDKSIYANELKSSFIKMLSQPRENEKGTR